MNMNREESGFSLIEILVSLLLFSFGVLGLVALQAQALKFSGDAEERIHAALLADEVISMMWAQQSASLSENELADWQTRVKTSAISGLPDTATGSVSTDSSSQVTTVSITWHSPSKLSSDNDSSYVTKIVIP